MIGHARKCLIDGCEADVEGWTNYCLRHEPFSQKGPVLRSKPPDERNNPIEQSATTVDTSGDLSPVGTPPRPPYNGPPGRGDDERKLPSEESARLVRAGAGDSVRAMSQELVTSIDQGKRGNCWEVPGTLPDSQNRVSRPAGYQRFQGCVTPTLGRQH